jgi:hypothetical protein
MTFSMALLLLLSLVGCASPRVYVEDSVTYHENDLSPCERGASGCTIGKHVYYSSLHPQTKAHEQEHAIGGMLHGPWITRSAHPCAMVHTAGTTQWKAGNWICRNERGDFYRGT